MKKKVIKFSGLCFLLIVTISCTTIPANPYSGLETVQTENEQVYTSRTGSDMVLVFLSGSGMNSVLGVQEGPVWTSYEFSYFITNSYGSVFDLAIPEKPGYDRGRDYAQRSDLFSTYTVEHLVESYVNTIDRYLDLHPYTTVILFGLSEGGLLAPRVYNKMKHKSRVSKMVVWGAGGFNQAESFRVLAQSQVLMPATYRRECARVDAVIEAIKDDPHSTIRFYLGWPYVRWNSFFTYTPANEYRSITIPVLFIQGKHDFSSPVESVYHIRDTFGTDTYTYWFREMGHVPEDKTAIEQILNEIAGWIRE